MVLWINYFYYKGYRAQNYACLLAHNCQNNHSELGLDIKL